MWNYTDQCNIWFIKKIYKKKDHTVIKFVLLIKLDKKNRFQGYSIAYWILYEQNWDISTLKNISKNISNISNGNKNNHIKCISSLIINSRVRSSSVLHNRTNTPTANVPITDPYSFRKFQSRTSGLFVGHQYN